MRSPQPAENTNSSLSKWLTYSGSVAAFLAVAPKAHAQVVYTDVDPDEVLDGTTMDIDFDGDGTVDVQFSQYGVASSTFGFDLVQAHLTAGNAVIGTVGSSTAIAYPSVLGAGSAIAPGDARFHSVSSQLLGAAVNGAANYGQWNGQQGYIGVRFAIAGEMHYGWVQLAVSSASETLTILGYAYESTPDMAINAGDEGMTTGIAGHAAPLRFGVSPNPARDRATVDFNALKSGTAQLSIVNGIGQVLDQQQVSVNNGDNTIDLDLARFPAGSYFVRLQNDDQIAFQKVVRVD